MARMVDDLFELSRIHAGALSSPASRSPLGDLVSEAIAGADPVARAQRRPAGRPRRGRGRGRPPTRPSCRGSWATWSSTRSGTRPADGTVEVGGRASADGVELSVSRRLRRHPARTTWPGSSTSPGAASRPARPDAEGGRRRGAGLGLAIVKGIVEAHRGDVRVENAGPGCRFLVRLPTG